MGCFSFFLYGILRFFVLLIYIADFAEPYRYSDIMFLSYFSLRVFCFSSQHLQNTHRIHL